MRENRGGRDLSIGSRHRALPAADRQIQHFADATLYRKTGVGISRTVWRREPGARPTRVSRRDQMSRRSFSRRGIHRTDRLEVVERLGSTPAERTDA